MTDNEKTAPYFSTEAEFELALRAGAKAAVTRFPTDAEWLDRCRSIKTFITRQGAGSSTSSEGIEEADAALLAKLFKSGADDCDEYEANVLIGKLTRADAQEAVPVTEGYEVPVVVVGGILTKHTLRIPSEKEMRQYRRGAFVFVDLRHGKQQLKTNPGAIGEFYDRLVVKTSGYQGEIPLCHKTAAIIELTQTVDALDAEEDPAIFI